MPVRLLTAFGLLKMQDYCRWEMLMDGRRVGAYPQTSDLETIYNLADLLSSAFKPMQWATVLRRMNFANATIEPHQNLEQPRSLPTRDGVYIRWIDCWMAPSWIIQ